MINDICYGRLTPIKNSAFYTRRGYPLMVDVKFWVPDSEPIYAYMDTYLSYICEDTEHRIYNPLKLTFQLNGLVSTIKTMYKKVDLVPTQFAIVSPEGRHELAV